MRAALLLALLSAWMAQPSLALVRGDGMGRQERGGQHLTCAAGTQAITWLSVCSGNTCQYGDEAAHGRDAITGQCSVRDTPDESDVWTDPRNLDTVETSPYAINCSLLIEPRSDFEWDPTEAPPNPGDPVEVYRAYCDATSEWPAEAGRTYTAGNWTLGDVEAARVELWMTCGETVAYADSAAADPMPGIKVNLPGCVCTLRQRVTAEQPADDGPPRGLVVRTWVNWSAEPPAPPPPPPPGGCGIGPELLALALLRRRRAS